MKPWEKYGTQTTESSGPWEKYSVSETPVSAAPVANEKTSWSDVGTQAVENLPKSGAEFVSNIWNAISHPVDTAKNLYNLGSGVAQVLGYPAAPGEENNKQTAMAVGQFFADRYGGMENVKKTIATDPVGFLSDASTALTAGGALATKLPGLAGKTGQAIATAGRAIDPLSLAGKAVKPVLTGTGKLAAHIVGDLGTHTGAESLKTAAKAGYRGGQSADDFLAAMRGTANPEDVVTDMKSALSNIRTERGTAYKTGMAGVKADTTVLDFAPIDQSLKDIANIGTFKGKVVTRSTADTLQKINGLVDEWRNSPAADFHTPEGLDALKRAIGDVRDSTEYGSPSRLMAGKVYNAVKDQIVKQAPEYGATMKSYEEASGLIKEIEKSLSLGEKASADTALRKLQSVLRNNVNTNFGNRLELVEKLKEAGASTVTEKLAGQSLSSVSPRGLGKLVAAGTVGAAYFNPAILALLAMESPRLMGEATYYGGKSAGLGRNALSRVPRGVPAAAFQAGRIENVLEEERQNALR